MSRVESRESKKEIRPSKKESRVFGKDSRVFKKESQDSRRRESKDDDTIQDLDHVSVNLSLVLGIQRRE